MKLNLNSLLFTLLLVVINLLGIALYLIFFVDSKPVIPAERKDYNVEIYDVDLRLNDERGAYIEVTGALYIEGQLQNEEYHGIELTSNAINFSSTNVFVDYLEADYRWSGFKYRLYLKDVKPSMEFSPMIGLSTENYNVNIKYEGDKLTKHHDGFSYEIYSNDGELALYYYQDDGWLSKLKPDKDFACVSKYSLEIAKSGKSFELVSCHDSLTEAREIMNTMTQSKSSTPIIRRYDNRIIDMKSGFVNLGVVPITEIIRMYNNLDDKTYQTYVNGQFGYESVFIKSEIEEYQRLKLKISGKSAWVNFEENENFLQLVPTSQILDYFEDVSHYKVFLIDGNRELNHKFTHRNIFLNDVSAIKIGFAPTFMDVNKKYYSFDGNYFYDDYLAMLEDGVAESNVNAINDDPYFNYYQYLPIRTESNYQGSDLDKYFEYRGLSRDSVMEGKGNYFVLAEQTTGINAAIEYAWASHESAFGTSRIALDKNNLFGMGAYDGNPYEGSLAFDSVLDGVTYHASKYISIGYTDALTDYRYYGSFLGNKASGFNVLYASDPYWGEKIAAHYFRMDLINGLKDYDQYQLLVKESDIALDLLYQINGEVAYKTMNNYKGYLIPNQVFVKVSEIDNYYKVYSDMPIRLDEKEVCIYTKFNTTTGLYDTIDKTSEVSVGEVGFACHYDFGMNNLYIKNTVYIKPIIEK